MLKEWYTMNKKGQSLVMFIIFLPLMIMGLALVVDVGIMYNAKIKGERLLEEANSKNLNIENYFEKNNIEIDKNSSQLTGECVIINYRVESVFGKILNIDDYKININNCE